ncbi:MAG: S41 family peptidase [Syntrophomonadaceae bacterium]|jgi:carboxyl-terminal processing protease|nr:S41 family peptidase [Syntrophomonadaceae bacterium]
MKKVWGIFFGLLLSVLGLLLFCNPLLAADDLVLDEIKVLIETHYVDELDLDRSNINFVGDLIAELRDPHSQYLSAEEMEEFIASIEGLYAGIGVYINGNLLTEGVEISGLIPNSPAEQAGIKTGDIIVRVDHKSLEGLDLDAVQQILLGPAGSKIELEVKRGKEHYKLILERQLIQVPQVSCTQLDFNTVYIDIDSFSETAYQDLLPKIDACRQEGVDKWIIDLRGNPGGYINAALDISGIFVGSEIVTVLEEREDISKYQAQQLGIQISDPVIVLIDENSASASEIMAAALKDHHQGVLLGQTTYGKGTAQAIFPLSNGDYLKLTTARFYSPLGFSINGTGVEPDLPLQSSDMIKAAELLLSDPPDGGAGSFELLADGHEFVVDLALARSSNYWGVWGEINSELELLPAYKAQAEEDYSLLNPQQFKNKASWYYPQAQDLGRLDNYQNSRELILYISPARDLGNQQLEVRHAASGAQLPFRVLQEGNLIRIQPEEEMLPGEYWLILKGKERDTYLARIEVQQ